MKLRDPIEVVLREKGREVHSVTSEVTVYEALVLMAKLRIGALVVINGTQLVGVFTERDYARKVIIVGQSSKTMRVGDIMSSPVVTVELSSTIDECMQHMTRRRCRHLPVMEAEKVVGLVSIGDLVNWIMTKQDQTIHDLEDYIAGDYPG